jgi:hypothetical protein
VHEPLLEQRRSGSDSEDQGKSLRARRSGVH